MNSLIVVRGGGDLATGTIYKLKKMGFDILVLETEKPAAIRRNVAFSEAVYEGKQTVEDMDCFFAADPEAAMTLISQGQLAMISDPDCNCLEILKPAAVIDAIIAKKNCGLNKDMAPVTIALGPGFNAGEDCDAVIETMRGHGLGRVIYEGCARPNTGVPGNISGFTSERVLHSPSEGRIKNIAKITDIVVKGDIIAEIESESGLTTPVVATMDGLLRGLIRDGYYVTKGFKIADIDPRVSELKNCFTISDKARCIAGGAAEALFCLVHEKGIKLETGGF